MDPDENLDDDLDLEQGQGGEGAVDFDVPDDGDFEVPTLTRAEKRRNRFREQIEAREDAEREVKRLRDEMESLKRSFQSAPQQPPQPKDDPLKGQLDDLYRRRRELAENYSTRQQGGGLTQEDHDSYIQRARELEEETMRVSARREIAASGAGNQRSPGDEVQSALKARAIDVAANPHAWKWAELEYSKRKLEGRPDSIDMFDEVMEDARRTYRIGKYKDGGEPSAATRSRLAGPPRGGAAPSGKPQGQKMTQLEREMADVMYSHISDPKERYRLYVKEQEGS